MMAMVARTVFSQTGICLLSSDGAEITMVTPQRVVIQNSQSR